MGLDGAPCQSIVIPCGPLYLYYAKKGYVTLAGAKNLIISQIEKLKKKWKKIKMSMRISDK